MTETIREITTHRVNPANDTLSIKVLDEPGAGGACHEYMITGFSRPPGEKTYQGKSVEGVTVGMRVSFQRGPINEVGVNGATQEVLLAIVADRLEGFQSGPFACADNAEALELINKAQEVLQRRTKERMARGVEGTHQK